MQDFRGARASAREALHDFHWFEYWPFAAMMTLQLLFLFLVSNLGSVWGMAGVGWIMRLAVGEPGLHYPGSYALLAKAHSMVEMFVSTVAGSFLIPLSLVRVMAPMAQFPARGPAALERARRAYPATFVSVLAYVAILQAWQAIVSAASAGLVHASGAVPANLAIWLVGAGVAYALAAVFLYVPIRAVERGGSFRDALVGGISSGLRLIGPTLFIVFVFAWPTLLVLAPIQLQASMVVERFQPEVIAVILGLVAVLASVINYLIYSAAARFHWLGTRKEE